VTGVQTCALPISRAPVNKMIFDLERTNVEEWRQYHYG